MDNVKNPTPANNKKKNRKVPLSERETEVLELAADGLTTTEVAERLELSFHTVEVYRKNILSKLQARNMIEAVKLYYRPVSKKR